MMFSPYSLADRLPYTDLIEHTLLEKVTAALSGHYQAIVSDGENFSVDTPPEQPLGENGTPDIYERLKQPMGRRDLWWSLAIFWFIAVSAFWALYLTERAERAERAAEHARWVSMIQAVSEPKTQRKRASNAPQRTRVVDKSRLAADLKAFAVPRFTDEELKTARAFIGHRLIDLGYTPVISAFGKGVNLIADLEGQDPAAGRFLLAAHFDSVANSPGADDNATGVVGLLELARVFKANPPRSSLRFVFFDAEERGLLGSRHFVRSPKHLKDVRGVIVLEMIGYTCSKPGCQAYPDGIPTLLRRPSGDFVTVVGNVEHLNLMRVFGEVGRENQIDVVAIPVPNQGHNMPDTRRSDHAPFWDHGVAAVMVTDTANFRNPHYHTAEDKPDTIDLVFFRDTVELTYRSILTLSSNSMSAGN